MRPAALIFDVDGTLAETEEMHRQAFNETFAAAGLGWHWTEATYRRLLDVAGGKERIAHFIAQGPERGAEFAGRIAELHAEKTQRYTALVAQGSRLRPGVARLIAQARAEGVALAIATTTSLPNVEALLRAALGADALDAFAVIGAGDVVGAKKPSPQIYHYVLERLGVNAADCVAFEDSRNGVGSACGAGIPTVVTPGIYTEGDDFTGALAVLSDLGEPGAPYRHLAGAGAADSVVTLEALSRWTATA
ncbi:MULTISPECIES: HAD-IA family hydrolase [Rhodopseudomonas]|uniref:Haloacid dehalogenase n=1 Tax=Rhodopseudomonas palustris TaxID=1076 RepID=A0A0D7E102_RHOPL|nr:MULTISPECIES: HAD-IA family hydrolase [Rhodopseudomonas]KIZ33332.1 haloacid dehalogenase [Rhodopseudomonas palustris]MDF3814078.1 HAD-IA family hydrolase [Rhodopseudomonas sp. BAL398]WOK15763.1 HAD-IA family hydrolase [Rhodopseudomonas sp. BAL398]